MPPRKPDRLSRLMRAFLEVDEFDLEDLSIGIGAYGWSAAHDWTRDHNDDYPQQRRIYWCSAHRRTVRLAREIHHPTSWNTLVHRGCSDGTPHDCDMHEVDSHSVDKDVVEVRHRGQPIRRWYLTPYVLRDREDVTLYKLLRERGDDPDTARDTVLAMGHASIDRLIAQLRQAS